MSDSEEAARTHKVSVDLEKSAVVIFRLDKNHPAIPLTEIELPNVGKPIDDDFDRIVRAIGETIVFDSPLLRSRLNL